MRDIKKIKINKTKTRNKKSTISFLKINERGKRVKKTFNWKENKQNHNRITNKKE